MIHTTTSVTAFSTFSRVRAAGIGAGVVCLHVWLGVLFVELAPKALSEHTPKPIRIQLVAQLPAAQPTPPAESTPPQTPLKPLANTDSGATSQPVSKPVSESVSISASTPAAVKTRTVEPATPALVKPSAPRSIPPLHANPTRPTHPAESVMTPVVLPSRAVDAASVAVAKAVEPASPAQQPQPFQHSQPPAPVSPKTVAIEGVAYRRAPVIEYPDTAREQEQEGTAIVRALIGVSGAVERASIERSSGSRLLDQAALSAVKQASFYPYRENGAAVAVMTLIPLQFRLEE